jgi:hypothetical protein
MIFSALSSKANRLSHRAQNALDPDLQRLISTAEQKISVSEVELEW